MIITFDKDKNILIGDLVVENKAELKEFRDYLMNDSFQNEKIPTYRVLSNVNKSTFRDLFRSGSFRKDDTLVVHKMLDYNSRDDICEYNEKIIASYYLNSILIFTSLLGEIDKSSVKPLAQQFIQHGIFRYDSFDKIWKVCSRRILERGNKSDLIALRVAFEEPDPIIRYEVSRVISEDESKHGGFLRGLDINALNQINCNSEILLGNNSLIKSKVKR